MLIEVDPLHEMFAKTVPVSPLYEDKAEVLSQSGGGGANELSADKSGKSELLHWEQEGKLGFGRHS